jgi:EsV-1-7 cysteine-rich motif
MTKCKFEGCKTRPYYNNPGETVGLYCKEHKKDGMVDVKNKKCKYEGCKTQPHYNNHGETVGLYCKEHKKDGAKNVNTKMDVINNHTTTIWDKLLDCIVEST